MNAHRRLRIAAWLAALAVIALPVVAAVNGWLASDRWPFRQLSVNGEFAHVSMEQLRATVAPALTPGYFAVDLNLVRDRVVALPWVEHAEVRKHWPDGIEITISERRPIALWGNDRLLSARGDLFSVPGNIFPEELPQFAGPEPRRIEVRDFFAQALSALKQTGLTPNGVLLSERGAWTLALSNGGELVLGREQAAQRLQRFAAVYQQLSTTDANRLQRADLRYENGFALRWAPLPDAGAMPIDVAPSGQPPTESNNPMAPSAVPNGPNHT